MTIPQRLADALVADGFDSEQSPEGIVRFMKGDAKVDLLAPDGLGADPVETGQGRVVQAPGATQAVKRAERSSRSQQLRPRSCPPHVSTSRSTSGISPPC